MDLTTLARTKAYIGGNMSVNVDSILIPLISRASDQACQYASRRFQRSTYTSRKLNGNGSQRLMLPDNPIISVTDPVYVDSTAYSLTTDTTSSGFQYDSKFIYLMGGAAFDKGLRNITITFEAGYATTQDGYVPAAPGPYALTPVSGSGVDPLGDPAQTAGPASVDRGVTKAGVAMVKVGSGPATGQYSFADGVYTFASADAGAAVTMTYDFVPGAVEQAVIEMVATSFERRKNLGVTSRSLDRETVTFDQRSMTLAVKEMLQPYRWIISP